MIYFAVLFLLVILAIRYDINEKTKYRDPWYLAVLVILILIAGLRFRVGEDTPVYIHQFYHTAPDLWNISIDTFLTNGDPPLWLMLVSIIKTIGGKFFWVQIIQASIVNILILRYFKKHSSYPFACVAVYFLWRYLWYNTVVMKSAIALSILLFANDYFLEKKHKKGILLVLLATGFHQSSIVMLMTPFFLFLRLNMFGLTLLLFSYFAGAFLQSQLGGVFEMMEFAEGMSNKLDNYMDSSAMSQAHNLNYMIVRILPILVYPIIFLIYIKKNSKESNLLKLEPFLMMGLLFQIMQLNINIFYRFVSIYSAYFILFTAEFFVLLSKNSIMLKRSLAYAKSLIIIFPLLFSFAYSYPFTRYDFYPYSSIVDRSVYKAREDVYSIRVPKYQLDEY